MALIKINKNKEEEEVKQKLTDFELKEIKKDQDLHQNYKEIAKAIYLQHKQFISRGMLYALKNKIIRIDEQHNVLVSSWKMGEYWKIEAIDNYFEERAFAEKKRLESLEKTLSMVSDRLKAGGLEDM